MHFHVGQSQADRVVKKLLDVAIFNKLWLKFVWQICQTKHDYSSSFLNSDFSASLVGVENTINLLCLWSSDTSAQPWCASMDQNPTTVKLHIKKKMPVFWHASYLTVFHLRNKQVNPLNEWFRCFKLGWISLKGLKYTFSEKNTI